MDKKNYFFFASIIFVYGIALALIIASFNHGFC
jgi:hypothetical protein